MDDSTRSLPGEDHRSKDRASCLRGRQGYCARAAVGKPLSAKGVAGAASERHGAQKWCAVLQELYSASSCSINNGIGLSDEVKPVAAMSCCRNLAQGHGMLDCPICWGTRGMQMPLEFYLSNAQERRGC